MKKTLFTAFLALLFTGMATAQRAPFTGTADDPSGSPAFTWDKTAYSFGQIPQGKPVTLTYEFTNAGKSPLIISNVIPSCGCTGAKWSEEAISPGKKGFVQITFNAAAMGVFSKSLTVVANTLPSNTTLTFNGEVVAEPAATNSR